MSINLRKIGQKKRITGKKKLVKKQNRLSPTQMFLHDKRA